MSEGHREQLLPVFEIEYRDHMAALRSMLAALERGEQADYLDFARRVHSLKGAARIIELEAAGQVAHALEGLLDSIVHDELQPDRGVVGLLRRGLDAIDDSALPVLEGRGTEDGESVSPLLTALHAVLQTRDVPVDVARPASAAALSAPIQTVRVSARQIDRVHETLNTLLHGLHRGRALGKEIARLREELAEVRRALVPSGRERERGPLGARGAANALDQLERRLVELAADQRQRNWSLRRLADQLAGDISRLRLVRVETMFAGLGRSARAIARDDGKEIEVRLQGGNLEVDRSVLQNLIDPVTHLVRNAVSHGIEPPEERIAVGKSAAGRITIKTALLGARLQVTVEDDGRGIDFDAVRRAAVQKGLLSDREAELAGHSYLINLILSPSFTTAGGVGSLSGRGLGLSIVERVVSSMQGDLAVESRMGQGTAFTLNVPTSVARQPLLLVACGGQVFALPMLAIRRVEKVPLPTLRQLGGRLLAHVAGGEVEVIPLAAALGLDSEWPDPAYLVTVRSRLARALLVDGVIDAIETPIRLLEGIGPLPEAIGGLAVRDDGVPVFVLRLRDLLAQRVDLEKAAMRRASPRERIILVVDDSLTTRTLERTILESQGYKVRLANDGAEGLRALEEGPIDAIVSDIEMPQMDGFAFVRNVRADARFSHLPVILVTSREDDDDKRLGMESGADAYIVKRHFQQDALLDAISRLLP